VSGGGAAHAILLFRDLAVRDLSSIFIFTLFTGANSATCLTMASAPIGRGLPMAAVGADLLKK